MLSVIYAKCFNIGLYAEGHYAKCFNIGLYAECHYAECRYAECLGVACSTAVFIRIGKSFYSTDGQLF